MFDPIAVFHFYTSWFFFSFAKTVMKTNQIPAVDVRRHWNVADGSYRQSFTVVRNGKGLMDVLWSSQENQSIQKWAFFYKCSAENVLISRATKCTEHSFPLDLQLCSLVASYYFENSIAKKKFIWEYYLTKKLLKHKYPICL